MDAAGRHGGPRASPLRRRRRHQLRAAALAARRGTGRKQHALRLRTATEIDALLRTAGFTEIEYYGDWDGSPFHHTAESLIAVARPVRASS
jgi:hypothetical protein